MVRERIAFVHRGEGSGLDPEAIRSQDGQLTVPNFEAVREDRLTLQLGELPAEVVTHIKAFSSLHLRWTSPWAYRTLDPFASRSPPGLHVSLQTVRGEPLTEEHACSLLKAFGVSQCSAEAFQSSSKSTQADQAPMLHYFESLEDLKVLSKNLRSLCSAGDDACQTRADNLLTASGFDLTYEAGEPVKVTAFWPLQTQELSVSDKPETRTEVGIFSEGSHFEPAPHAVGLMGDLMVLGEDEKPTPTSFQIHSRHRQSEGYFSSSFLSPTGLHPSLQLRIGDAKPPQSDAGCSLYAYLSLPKTVFPDQYQLQDHLFMASKNLTKLAQQWGVVDLEAPAYRTKTWGSSMLLELAAPSSDDMQQWTAEVPLHLRYLEPSKAGKSDIEIPYPALFWACEADEGDVNFKNNPFDRPTIGYDSLFSPTTAFWHLDPRPEVGNRLMNSIIVPVLQAPGAGLVEAGTSAAIALGFGWVLWKLASSFTIFGYGNNVSSNQKESARKKQ